MPKISQQDFCIFWRGLLRPRLLLAGISFRAMCVALAILSAATPELARSQPIGDSATLIQRQRLSQMMCDKIPSLGEKRAEVAASDFIEHLRQNSPIAAEQFINGQMDDDEVRSRVDVYLRDHPELSGDAAPATPDSARNKVSQLLKSEKGIADNASERLAIADRFIERLGELSGTAHDDLIQGRMSSEELESRVKVFAADLRAETAAPVGDPAEIAAAPVVESFVRANFGRSTERTNSISYRGTVESKGSIREFVTFKKRPGKIRIHIMEHGTVIGLVGFDGTTGWRQSRGQPAVPLVGSEADELALQARFDDPLVDYKDRGDRIRLDEKGSDKGFHLHIFESDGSEMISTIDSATLNEVSLRRRNPGEDWQETKFSAYKKIGPVNIPFVEEQWINGSLKFTTRLTEVKLDPGILDGFFSKPLPSELDFLDYMGALAIVRTREKGNLVPGTDPLGVN